MLARGSKHPCCKPKQCKFLDHFIRPDDRWSDVSDGGVIDGAGYSVDRPNEVLNATGNGSYTLEIEPGSKYASVEALLIDNGTQTESGVVFGRADEPGCISLVRVWGTADAYELREGSTVLQAFTASGTTKVKLKITSPVVGETSKAECYVDGTLAHTENVLVPLTGSFALGVTCEGGGRWDWCEVSPCPIPCGFEYANLSDCIEIVLPWTDCNAGFDTCEPLGGVQALKHASLPEMKPVWEELGPQPNVPPNPCDYWYSAIHDVPSLPGFKVVWALILAKNYPGLPGFWWKLDYRTYSGGSWGSYASFYRAAAGGTGGQWIDPVAFNNVSGSPGACNGCPGVTGAQVFAEGVACP